MNSSPALESDGAAMTHGLSASGGGPQHPGQAPRDQMRFFTVAAVAAFFAVSTRTVRRWIKGGDLVAHRFGTAVRIAESDLKAFIAHQRDC
jgi:excisionase family DNA binding protein